MKKFVGIALVICLLAGTMTACMNEESRHHTKVARMMRKQVSQIEEVDHFGKIEEAKNAIDIGFVENALFWITDTGEVFQYGYYSDGSTVRKVDSAIKAKRFCSRYIVDENGVHYRYDSETNTLSKYESAADHDHDRTARYVFDLDIVTANLELVESKEIVFHLYEWKGTDKGTETTTTVDSWPFDADETVEYVTDNMIKTNKRFYCLDFAEVISAYDDVQTEYTYRLYPIDIPLESVQLLDLVITDGARNVVLVENDGNIYFAKILYVR